MRIDTHSIADTQSQGELPSFLRPTCPLCGGELVALRNLYRCSRCSYGICAGCEQVECCSIPETS
jgi:hypothetical protein